MQKQSIEKRESVIDTFDDQWEEAILTSVMRMLKDGMPGRACMTTPSGREVQVFVWFRNGGSA